MNKRDPRIFDVYRINVNSGEMEMSAENPGNITEWMTDHDGNLRIATTTDGVNTGILYRKSEQEEFRLIVTTNFKDTLSPSMFTYDNQLVYMLSNIGRDKLAIVKYDIENNKELEVIYEHPEVDAGAILSSDKRKVITGISFVTDKRHYHFFDEQRKQLQKDLEEKLPGYEVIVSSSSREEDKILVRTFSDKSQRRILLLRLK